MAYKVWVEIEYIDHDGDEYDSHIAEPVPLGEFDTIEEAVAEVERVTGEPPGWFYTDAERKGGEGE